MTLEHSESRSNEFLLAIQIDILESDDVFGKTIFNFMTFWIKVIQRQQ